MWHRQGKVSLTKGSDVVTGVGTAWVENIRVGDAFQGPDGKLYQVINVASNEALAISPAYEGNTATNLNYWIVPVPGYSKTQADRLSLIISKLDGDILSATDAADRAQVAAQQAQQWGNEAAASAAAALQSEQSAALSADIAEHARDDAVAVVTGGTASIDPEAGKIPIAGAEASIKQAWIENLQFELDALRVAKNRLLYGDGPYPVLDFQFAGAKYLDPRIQFTRASVDWDDRGRGYGVNEPVLTDKGLWASGSRSNLIKWSNDLTKPDWLMSSSQYFRTIYPTVHPQRGLINATLYGPREGYSTFSTGVVRQMVTLQGDTTYTIWLDVKSSDTINITSVRPEFLMPVGINAPASGVFGLLSGATATPRDDNEHYKDVAVSNVDLGDGWRRLSITLTVLSRALEITLRFYPYYGGALLTGDGENGLIVSNVQVESNGVPTRNIPTESTQVTVAATNFEYSVDGLFDDEGAVVFSAYLPGPRVSNGFTLTMVGDGGSSEYMGMGYGTTIAAGVYLASGGVTSNRNLPNNIGPKYNELNKLGFAWAGRDFAFYINGVEVHSGVHGAVMPVYRRLYIARRANQFYAPVEAKSLQLYTKRLTNEQMRDLTTL